MDAWFWVWVGLAAILSVAEIFTGGFFMLPFGLGAAFAAAGNALGASVAVQWAVFIGASVILLAALRPLARRVTKDSPLKVGAERLVGQTGLVIEALDHGANTGLVQIAREQWRADAPGFEPVATGTAVRVVRVEGTHLIVEPADGGSNTD